MIRRKIMIALFALGTVGGFASGIHSMRRNHCRRDWDRREMRHDCRDGSDDGPRHHPRKWAEEE